jgi:hypothetical protein
MSIFLFSCKNETKSEQPEIKIAPVVSQLIDLGEIEEVSFKTKGALKVFHYYIKLKNSLVNTDAVLAAKASLMLKDVITSIKHDKHFN